MNKNKYIVLIAINVIIALSFFVKNIQVDYSQLSSDQHNIIPMCLKIDDPSLFEEGDLFLSNPNNFKYYTPFFIHTVRFFGNMFGGDYIKGLNALLFISHLIFGLLWFLLFYKVLNQFWISLLMSILIRGIVWLPGFEIWGISDLWTLMPRTLYLVLFPIPFLVLEKNNSGKLFFAGFLVGLIFNFHPISGLGGILLFISFLILMKLFFNQFKSVKNLLITFLFIVLGMLPFLITYFSKTSIQAQYDLTLYEAAFNARIPSFFKNPLLFINKWIAFKTLFFIIPLIGYLVIVYIYDKKQIKIAISLIVLSAILFIIPLLSIPIENYLNNTFHTNLRMAFQLVRVQKFAILPTYFSLGFLLASFTNKSLFFKKIFPYIFLFYSMIVVISHSVIFDKVPFVSDDITRGILPAFSDIIKPFDQRKTNFDKMAKFISENTPKNAVFYENFMLRSASKRSVKYDVKGASILVEGDPKELIHWYISIKKLNTLDEFGKISFLKENGVDYILSKKTITNQHGVKHIHAIGNLNLYKIN